MEGWYILLYFCNLWPQQGESQTQEAGELIPGERWILQVMEGILPTPSKILRLVEKIRPLQRRTSMKPMIKSQK
jgi:hypothetical protein